MASTIPASHFVNVIPNVIGAGGKALDLNGLLLSKLTTVPYGTVASFPDAASVTAYFGAASLEAQMAVDYFAGFNGATATPGALLFAQRPIAAVPAYMRGGSVAALTIAQLNNISGILTMTVDGRTFTTGNIDLSTANSFSDAAATIQTAIGAVDTTTPAFTAAIASSTTTGPGSIVGETLTIHGSPRLFIGSAVSGSGVTAGTVVTGFLSGNGGAGQYTVSPATTNTGTITLTVTNGLLTVSAVSVGTLAVGNVIQGSGVTSGTSIVGLGTGTGGTGTYYVIPGQTASSTAMTVVGITVTYDSTFGGFDITSGTLGVNSSITFATGTAAAPLKLTAATGAVLSQGAVPYAPISVLMDNIVAITQNWATFATVGTDAIGNQLLLAQWANAQGSRYGYVDWSTNAAIVTSPDTTSAFYQIDQAGYGSVIKVYGATTNGAALNAAFVMGYFASLDFTATNGRATLAYRSQDGQVASVTSSTIASLLESTGINYYGATATANTGFTFMYPGAITGKFAWADSFANQIWLNNELQLALLELLTTVKSVPYNSAGYGLIRAACLDPINAAINFGAIRVGVTLSALQIAEVKAAAGLDISVPLQSTGYYLQILDASAQVRGQRGSPPINLFYSDGESVQKITVNSILVQ